MGLKIKCLPQLEVFVSMSGITVAIKTIRINTNLLERELKKFEINTRFTSVKYIKMDENKGISYCLREGVNSCSHEIIIKMDSDDIMMNNRIITQLEFMKNNNDCVMCGSNIQFFKTSSNYKEKLLLQNTTHTYKITWNDYKKTKSHWIMNHPSLCYKKTAVLSVGNYNTKMGSMSEDLELELRVLKKYGVVYNIQESLLQYRIHDEQTTYNGNSLKENHVSLRNKVIDEIINE
jgi:glycosyltransferase involved in cell wall biosynthesis